MLVISSTLQLSSQSRDSVHDNSNNFLPVEKNNEPGSHLVFCCCFCKCKSLGKEFQGRNLWKALVKFVLLNTYELPAFIEDFCVFVKQLTNEHLVTPLHTLIGNLSNFTS